MSATLEAATVDEDVAELVRSGRLDRERSSAAAGFGFGDLGDWTPPPPRAKPAKAAKPAKQPAKAAKPARADRAARDDGLERRLTQAAAEAKARAAELHDAEVRVRDLQADLARATRALREARTRSRRADLDVEQLRQRAWEAGERGR